MRLHQRRILANCLRMELYRRSHPGALAGGAAAELWGRYAGELFQVDAWYRQLVCDLTRCVRRPPVSSGDDLGGELVAALDEAIRALAASAERLYKGWFLEGLGSAWSSAVQGDLARLGHVDGAPPSSGASLPRRSSRCSGAARVRSSSSSPMRCATRWPTSSRSGSSARRAASASSPAAGPPSPRSRAWAWRRCSRPPRSSSDSLLRVRMGASGCGDLPSSLMGFTPRGYLRVAQPGAGEAFVHGGASLQELCVPILRFRNLRRGSRGYVEAHAARIALLGASRSITVPRVALDIQQLDAVAGKVCPALYEVCFEDASGERLSSSVRVRADRREVNGCAGAISVWLDLTRLPSDGSRDAFLVARDEQGGEVVRERFSLDPVAGALTPGLA